VNNKHIILFFTQGMSLAGWDNAGIFSREISIYNRLMLKGFKVSFVTYGNRSEFEYADKVSGINILCNKWGFSKNIYKKYLHLLHRNHLKSCTIIKTNQMNGAHIALKTAKYYNKPLINRMGYMLSNFVKHEKGDYKNVEKYENHIFEKANEIVVTSKEMCQNIVRRNKQLKNKISIIPNYVNTELFKPAMNDEKEFDLLFIGRITHQKNIQGLLEALKEINIKALIIGNGDLKKGLIEQYGNLDGRIFWQNAIPHNEISNIMNKCSIYILPSFYEGHPKTLIEAMATGMPVIGANSPGINNLIKDGVNGILCETGVSNIQYAIEYLLANPILRKKISKNAYQHALTNYSLSKIVDIEIQVYNKLYDNFHY